MQGIKYINALIIAAIILFLTYSFVTATISDLQPEATQGDAVGMIILRVAILVGLYGYVVPLVIKDLKRRKK